MVKASSASRGLSSSAPFMVASASSRRARRDWRKPIALTTSAHALTQHASKNSSRYVSCGRLLFELENDWTALEF